MPARILPFYKLSPGGNPTILVRDNCLLAPDVLPATRAAIARSLMDTDGIGAEQVGFLDTSRALPHMEMMGGEFCINATRAAALIFALQGLLPKSDIPGVHEGNITTSGTQVAVRVRVNTLSPESRLSATMAREAAVALRLAATAQTDYLQECAPGEILAHLPGITHLLLDAASHPMPDCPLAAAQKKRAEYNLDKEEAAGVIWYALGPGGTASITPVVHVAATGSSVAETACGSGSLALALLMAHSATKTITIHQPSGHALTVTFEPSAPSTSSLTVWISGIVRLVAEGEAYLSTVE